MTTITWDRLGPREKQVLALLREAGEPRSTRDVLSDLRAEGGDVAYTTISTVLDRLADKGLVSRDREVQRGTSRYLYRFEAGTHREPLVDDVVDDVEAVLGSEGLSMLAQRSRAVAETAETAETAENDREETNEE